ncbi:MAG: acyltransferase [Lachnospiraceae bacterium]|nr:acyltransferase [Lachnospiraceae bacterium]
MENGLSKEQSKMLQGLAILMMLYHHLFSTPEALGIPYRSLLVFGEINAELRMAWFFKICVGIYAFVSGYGICRSMNRSEHSGKLHYDGTFFQKLIADYRIVAKRFFGFYQQFLLVFVIFVPVGFLFFHKPFDIKELLLNLIGISTTYNGAWWYVLQYFKMLLILPVIDSVCTIYKGKKEMLPILSFIFGLCGVCAGLMAGHLLMPLIDWFQPAFTMCFIMGYLISRFELYEIAYRMVVYIISKAVRLKSDRKEEKDRTISKTAEKVLNVLGIIAFFLVIICRVKIAKDASSAGLDFIFVPVFAFGFARITMMLKRISKLFLFFGGYSTFIWLTHVFYYDHYMKKTIMFSGVSAGIYLTLLLVSLFGAFLLERLFRFLKSLMKLSK